MDFKFPKIPTEKTLLGKFFRDDKQVENVIKFLIALVLSILVIVITVSLVVNPQSLNVEKNQLIVVVITTILNGFSILVYKFFKSPSNSRLESLHEHGRLEPEN